MNYLPPPFPSPAASRAHSQHIGDSIRDLLEGGATYIVLSSPVLAPGDVGITAHRMVPRLNPAPETDGTDLTIEWTVRGYDPSITAAFDSAVDEMNGEADA